MSHYFEPREYRIEPQYRTECGHCGHHQHEHEPVRRCSETGCKTRGCATCVTICRDCGGGFCWGHMVRSYSLESEEETQTCRRCTIAADTDAKAVAA